MIGKVILSIVVLLSPVAVSASEETVTSSSGVQLVLRTPLERALWKAAVRNEQKFNEQLALNRALQTQFDALWEEFLTMPAPPPPVALELELGFFNRNPEMAAFLGALSGSALAGLGWALDRAINPVRD